MVFSNLIFVGVFLPLVFVLYYICKNTSYRNVILVLTSLVFYAWGEPSLVIMLAVSITLNYIYGLLIDKFYAGPGAKAAFTAALITNFGFLGVFKYAGFVVDNLNALLPFEIPEPNISLPLGISFYTFQILSYIIDLYKGRVKVQKSLIKFAGYVSMFPQLVAGPIVRYADIAEELDSRTVTADDFADGSKRFVAGLCKKLLLANNAGSAASMLLDNMNMATGTAWLGILMYTFQIYFDFSSYSDMAIGLGRMFGFHFIENFRYPYISRSITEFWRRWHISLSTFFRDYVYIPLGGNRYRAVRNLFIVWFLTGMWHGASWNFILWGLFYGVFLFIEKSSFKQFLMKIPRPFCYIYTMFFVMVGWALFYYTDTAQLINWFKCAFGKSGAGYDLVTVTTLCSNAWLIAVCIIGSTPLPAWLCRKICSVKGIGIWLEPLMLIAAFVICYSVMVGSTYNPFLYFRF
ncbi:MAG: MBOAT family O-acyltransferase [bacterium]|nr:MBOAT family O-acyltransferase [bacterium]